MACAAMIPRANVRVLEREPIKAPAVMPGCLWRRRFLEAQDAEARLRDRRVKGGGDAQAQHSACLRRIDDAVIPQAGGAVIGVALFLILGEDRCLELLLFLRRHGLVAP